MNSLYVQTPLGVWVPVQFWKWAQFSDSASQPQPRSQAYPVSYSLVCVDSNAHYCQCKPENKSKVGLGTKLVYAINKRRWIFAKVIGSLATFTGRLVSQVFPKLSLKLAWEGGEEEEPENAASHGWFLDGYKS